MNSPMPVWDESDHPSSILLKVLSEVVGDPSCLCFPFVVSTVSSFFGLIRRTKQPPSLACWHSSRSHALDWGRTSLRSDHWLMVEHSVVATLEYHPYGTWAPIDHSQHTIYELDICTVR
jgi:hypothetical protein